MKTDLKIYDTAEKEKRKFESLSPGLVKMYCCGPTVYDYLHIGNFRGAVFFNFVRNWLEFLNYKVDYIYNFTDIDDKILNRSLKEQIEPQKLAERYISEFKKDYKALSLSPHTANPRATETLKEIIKLIELLIQEGKAYEINGNVFYSISSFKQYGMLSKRKPKDMLTGVRIDPNENKKNPLDFALWKKVKEGETWSFDSPWGKGRPGWHIECTAMIYKFLGKQIDIHAGGSDLVFPHHENEIAQSAVLTQKKHVNFWMHNNMIVMGEDKMSKSLGNILTMREFLKQHPAELFKFLILSCHYRSPLQFSKNTLTQALTSLFKFYSSFLSAEELLKENNNLETCPSFKNKKELAEQEIKQAFNDDFATPKAFAVFFSLLKSFNSIKEDANIPKEQKAYTAKEYLSFFEKYGKLLALFQEKPQNFLKEIENRLLEQKQIKKEDIEKLIKERALARQNKDFKKADQLRDKIEGLGIELKDQADGTQWRLKN